MLPPPLQDTLQPITGAIRKTTLLGGGCIAKATRVEAENGRFFLKWGSDEVAMTFEAEAIGLAALAEAGAPLRIPRVLDVGENHLVLEWIEPGQKPPEFWESFGRGLAELHRSRGDSYGFSADNFIGKTPQFNTWMSRWDNFFRDCRLVPQVRLARSLGVWRSGWDRLFEEMCRRLSDLLPAEPPASILHGDLWSGNFMVSGAGEAVLIDPAVYYGHYEVDLAMTELFGGFDQRFYASYSEITSIDAGYDKRREVYNLYHLINHLNLFGGSYAGGVERILRRFG